MSKTIPGVPESITRAAYTSLIAATGIDPHAITELSFRANGIYATVFYINERGAKEADRIGDTFLKHTVYIPVEDEE